MDQAIVIDFFGVICSEVAPFWLAKYFSESRAAEIKANIVHTADLGRISQSEMFNRLAQLAGISTRRVEQEWESEGRIDFDLVDVLRTGAPLYKFGLLTNSPSPFVRAILEKHDLAKMFRAIVVSSEIGIAKPDRRAFEYILEELNAVAGSAV